MSIEYSYIDDRLDNQIEYYEKSSQKFGNLYKWLTVFQLALTATIPVLTLFLNKELGAIKITIAVVSGLSGVVAGYLLINKCHDNWIRYRTTSEKLKREKALYLSGAGLYKEETTAFDVFTENCENIMNEERAGWEVIQQPNPAHKSV